MTILHNVALKKKLFYWLLNKALFTTLSPNTEFSKMHSFLFLVLFYFFLILVTTAALWRGVQTVSSVPSVPDRIQALVGSCVIVPCSFNPVAPQVHRKAKKEVVSIRLSFRDGSQFFPLRITAFNNEDQNQTSRDFQGRTTLFGRITDGDCSLKIERIKMDDARVFEIALKRAGDFPWGKPRKFSLDVVGEWGHHCSAPHVKVE